MPIFFHHWVVILIHFCTNNPLTAKIPIDSRHQTYKKERANKPYFSTIKWSDVKIIDLIRLLYFFNYFACHIQLVTLSVNTNEIVHGLSTHSINCTTMQVFVLYCFCFFYFCYNFIQPQSLLLTILSVS